MAKEKCRVRIGVVERFQALGGIMFGTPLLEKVFEFKTSPELGTDLDVGLSFLAHVSLVGEDDSGLILECDLEGKDWNSLVERGLESLGQDGWSLLTEAKVMRWSRVLSMMEQMARGK